MIMYGQAVARMLTGDFSLRRDALVNFDGKRWTILVFLIVLALAVVLSRFSLVQQGPPPGEKAGV